MGYVHNKNPEHFDDVQGNGEIFEIVDIGKSTYCKPSPGIFYSALNDKRLYISHARPGIDDAALFINRMLSNIENWPRMRRDQILFDMVDINHVSDSISQSKKTTEMKGIQRMNSVVVSQGGFVRAPKRQNETVDSVIVFNDLEIGISNKTATIGSRDGKQRHFILGAAPFNLFSSVVVAFYPDDHNKFAVMSSADVYDTSLGHSNFSWNESLLKPSVHIFDVSSNAGCAEFMECIVEEFLKRNATDDPTIALIN